MFKGWKDGRKWYPKRSFELEHEENAMLEDVKRWN
jgi:hypothetical protein